MKDKVFSRTEVIFLIAIGLVMGFRELSMTMVNPFITIYGKQLQYNTPFLCGLGLGIYGLTNALFQIPYGLISDMLGRKKVILVGLLQLSLGLFIAFLSKNIYVFIFSRALQGSGAVMAIAYSWIGDNIEDKKKDKAMGISGTIVGIGAVAAFVLGPMLYKVISVSKMFLDCSIIIALTIVFIFFFIPENIKANKEEILQSENSINLFKASLVKVLKDITILRLSICGFIINYIMAATFLIVPDILQKLIGVSNMWKVFLPAVLIGIISMQGAIALCDRGMFIKVSMASFLVLLIGTKCISYYSLTAVTLGVILILSGFITLTSLIPSTINKLTDKEYRGTANGLYQTFTFLGFCVGPTLTGFLQGKNLNLYIFYVTIALAIVGATISYTLKNDGDK
ncbi:MFS transporter [Clostridium manihotivorum]|uniref:MFS transporter n=1 Tax=Clostridium manihotivorum TaxID=2320868 RepID=A0A3R5QTV7_9CLOT|nr:MFS transporter [Clostridium manihotivorum]QAA32497.1 MFS transporter [Clostridium manihotivorum]